MGLRVKLAGLAFLLPAAVLAQIPSDGTGDDIKALPKTFLTDQWRMWSSPFRVENYDQHTVVKYMLPFAAIETGLIAVDPTLADSLPNTSDQNKWSSHVSSVGLVGLIAVPAGTYVVGHFTHDEHAAETGLLALEALGHSQVFAFGLKQITNRQRPDNPQLSGRGFWDGGDSFPSGHAASAFAVAAVYAYEYRNHIAVPIAAYSAATLISLSRIGARRHWASDVFGGASMGFLIGRYTYKRNHRGATPKQALRDKLTPEIGMGFGGPTLSWSF